MNKKILGGFVVLVVLLGGAYTYSQKSDEPTGEEAKKQVTIGVIAGTTGEYAFVGENWVKGLKVAQDDWNRLHPDVPVKLVIEDDGFEAPKGLSAYKKLTSFDKVDAMLNMTSVTIDAIYADVVKSGIPLVQMGEQGIEPEDDNVIQLMEGNMVTERALGAYAKEKGYKNLAVFISNNATFERFYNGFKEGYGSEHSVYRINPGDQSLKTEVIKAMSLKPDAVVIVLVPADGAVVAREVNMKSVETPLLFDGSAFTGFPEYEKVLGGTSLLNGDAVVVIKQSAVAEAFTDTYKAKYGEDVGIGSAWGYESFMFLLGTQPENLSDHTTWVKNMKTKSIEGLSGPIKLDEVGVRLPEYFIGTIKDGKLPTE